jgi:alginate O-acetyltransferase complex protein AlgI
MSLAQILLLSAFAVLFGGLAAPRWRGRILLIASLLSLFWLQPSSPVRNLDFWLPVASITLTLFVWSITRSQPSEVRRATFASTGLILGIILAVGLMRYSGPLCCITATRPPDFLRVLLGLAIAGVLVALPYRFSKARLFPVIGILFILVLFIILKTEKLSLALNAALRSLSGQPPGLASPVDLPWLGFSYLAFRLLHVLRDHQAGKLPPLSLEEFVTYALFFPALTAGPIDRAPRFASDLQRSAASTQPVLRSDPTALFFSGQRILIGVFKKFVLADSLALLALNSQNASQVNHSAWAWVLLYAYALRIYFDFSGYTDIAIGLGLLLGIRLPENFDRPYLKTNLTAFWNTWHMTLAQWFRAYFFNPATRNLRTRPQCLPTWLIILLGQMGTMLLIGLWHGITWNFVAWGAWHGFGLFVHNRWTDWLRPRMADRQVSQAMQRLLQASGWLLTFHYVALGWVWFALPDISLSWQVFLKLFGL